MLSIGGETRSQRLGSFDPRAFVVYRLMFSFNKSRGVLHALLVSLAPIEATLRRGRASFAGRVHLCHECVFENCFGLIGNFGEPLKMCSEDL